ncbi:hypothetical protein [Nonomuraea sp. WAC 01424]|uniref:hypothetical protein n=1 Tax=Nonomuraea sp. WAC 01424 TaxID=2203200 RepID=UPI00163C7E9C|nr:hypothetical protein [Nonomuraea sp. WAC 01424]
MGSLRPLAAARLPDGAPVIAAVVGDGGLWAWDLATGEPLYWTEPSSPRRAGDWPR